MFGRYVYAIGNREAAAYLSGVPTRAVLVAAFALCGLCAGLAGVLLAGYSTKAYQGMGDAYLLPSIAAVVIGGTHILGGRGRYAGTVVGTILITLLSSVLSVMQMPEAGRQIIYGLVIIAMLLAYGGAGRPAPERTRELGDRHSPVRPERATGLRTLRRRQRADAQLELALLGVEEADEVVLERRARAEIAEIDVAPQVDRVEHVNHRVEVDPVGDDRLRRHRRGDHRIGDEAGEVAHVGRPQHRHHQIGAVADAPVAEGQAEIQRLLGHAHRRRDVEQARARRPSS